MFNLISFILFALTQPLFAEVSLGAPQSLYGSFPQGLEQPQCETGAELGLCLCRQILEDGSEVYAICPQLGLQFPTASNPSNQISPSESQWDTSSGSALLMNTATNLDSSPESISASSKSVVGAGAGAIPVSFEENYQPVFGSGCKKKKKGK